MVSPLVTATVHSGLLAGLSNFLAQALQSWQEKTPLRLELAGIIHFTLYAALTTPLNFTWQSWLEAQYPGYTDSLSPLEKEKLVDDLTTGQSTGLDEKANASVSQRNVDSHAIKDKIVSTGSKSQAKKLNLTNTAIKFALDNTFGALVNTLLFIVGIGLLRGESLAEIQKNLDEKFWTMLLAGQKLWPAVSVLSLTAIPVQHRTTFGAVVGLFWGIYLSILTRQG